MSRLAFDWKGLPATVLLDADVRRVRDQRGHELVRVPYRLPNGQEHNAKLIGRHRSWWERVGTGLIPYGLELLPEPPTARRAVLLVAEGESDALALRSEFVSLDEHTVYVLGLPGACTWKPEWTGFLAAFPLIYVLPDGDNTGRRMADAVMRSVPWARTCWLPGGEDCRSLIQSGRADAIVEAITVADETARLVATFLLAPTVTDFTRIWNGGACHAAA